MARRYTAEAVFALVLIVRDLQAPPALRFRAALALPRARLRAGAEARCSPGWRPRALAGAPPARTRAAGPA
ncbi:MAG: hypothetical protein WDN49_09375 [Acetobacteraceae bacterium]